MTNSASSGHPEGSVRQACARAFFCLDVMIVHVIVDRAVGLSGSQRRSRAASEGQEDGRERVGVLPADGRVQLSRNREGAGRTRTASAPLIIRPETPPQPPLRSLNYSEPLRQGFDRHSPDRRTRSARRCAAFPYRAIQLDPTSLGDAHERSFV